MSNWLYSSTTEVMPTTLGNVEVSPTKLLQQPYVGSAYFKGNTLRINRRLNASELGVELLA